MGIWFFREEGEKQWGQLTQSEVEIPAEGVGDGVIQSWEMSGFEALIVDDREFR